jgi:4-hydroxy-tetrahydrodipicolinate synthase
LIEHQIAGGVYGIVPCGTTGESPTLSHQEHNLLIDLCVKIANKRIKIMAGTGSNSTSEAVMMTQYAKKVGADSCLVVSPYYNKPTPQGIFEHYKAINKCDLPIIIYNIPGRSVINISDELIAKMVNDLKNIAGVKDATGDLARVANLRKLINKNFALLSGEDSTALGFNAMGGNGIISVTANIAPKLVSDLQKLSSQGKFAEALKVQDLLTNLHNSLFCETNPIPVKYAVSLLGLCSQEVRLPLTSPSDSSKARIKDEMQKIGLI